MALLFRQEVLDSKTQRLSGEVSLVQPPAFKSLTLLILSLVIIAAIYLYTNSYSKKVKVNGVLQPNTGLLKLSAPQSGVVTELLVKEGDEVIKNQPLLRVTSEKYGVKGFELNQSLISQLEYQITTLKQQLKKQKLRHSFAAKAIAENQQTLQKKLTQLNNQHAIFTKRLKLNQEIVKQIRSLSDTGFISDLELRKQQDSFLALDQQASLIESERLTLIDQIDQQNSKLSQLPLIQSKENDIIESQLVEITTQYYKIKQQRLGELRAPREGIITGLLIKGGKSVRENQSLLSILPKNSTLQAIVYVPTAAFGFITKGQVAKLRYHAFPYQRFGIYQGKIEEISANVILPEETDIPGLISVPSYRLVISIENQNIRAYERDIPLRSGMKLDADIIVDRHSLIRWLFDPLFSLKSRL